MVGGNRQLVSIPSGSCIFPREARDGPALTEAAAAAGKSMHRIDRIDVAWIT